MTPEQFCYWLQGQMELSGGDTELSQSQIRMIAEHLSTVFNKITPVTAPYTSQFKQDKLMDINPTPYEVYC